MAFQLNPLKIPLGPGVYIFQDKMGKPLYVGKAVNLRQRVSSYFQKRIALLPRTQLMVAKVQKVETVRTATELEALLLEIDLIKRLKPKYNVQWRDDKRYQFIKISNFQIPISKLQKEGQWYLVGTSRKADDSNAVFFGPFPEARVVSELLRSLRKVFPWCKYKSAAAAKRAKAAKRGCFYYQMGLCPGICAGKIKIEQYQKIIDNLVRVLAGESRSLIKEWQQKMGQAAKDGNFEEAAKQRDLVKKLDYVTQSFHDSSEYLKNPNLLQDQRSQELEELTRELKPLLSLSPSAPSNFRIEAYDVSNIQGSFATGAKVSFVGGEPCKSEYRRYRIDLGQGKLPNDLAALQEVISRRFREAKRKVEEVKKASKKDVNSTTAVAHLSSFEELPDLVLIDGGKGQVGAVLEVLQKLKIKVPVIGLAKKQEEIVVPYEENSRNLRYKTLRLPKDSPALKFLQRVRDEAHRFAVLYHRKLRQRNLVENTH